MYTKENPIDTRIVFNYYNGLYFKNKKDLLEAVEILSTAGLFMDTRYSLEAAIIEQVKFLMLEAKNNGSHFEKNDFTSILNDIDKGQINDMIESFVKSIVSEYEILI